jgi:glycosyltransferase involved in cell wall biosynthesis
MDIMKDFHVFVLPSHTTPVWKEQFGVVLIEAMFSHAAVVGSSSGAIPEVVGDAGVIFPRRRWRGFDSRFAAPTR